MWWIRKLLKINVCDKLVKKVDIIQAVVPNNLVKEK